MFKGEAEGEGFHEGDTEGARERKGIRKETTIQVMGV